MLVKTLWVPALGLMPKVAIGGLAKSTEKLSGISRVGDNLVKSEAKAPVPQVTSFIYSPSPPHRISFETIPSHEADVTMQGSEAQNLYEVNGDFPIHVPHDQNLQATSELHWEFASQAAYQKANKELLELGELDHSIWQSSEIQFCPKLKPDGLTDFSITSLVKGDGSCQFRAISLIMTGSQENHILFRNEAVAHMESAPDQYKGFANFADPGAGGSWEGYLEKLRQPTTYGNHLTLEAMAEIWQRKFVVLNERSTHDGVDIVTAKPKNENVPIALLYLNNEHYELLLTDRPTHIPSLNHLRGSYSFPPSNYRPSQPSSTSSSSSESSSSDGFREVSFQEDPRSKTFAMKLPEISTHKVKSFVSGQPETPPPPPRTRDELRTTGSGGARIAPAEADTIPDPDPIPLIDHTQPATELPSSTKEGYPPFDGPRFSRHGEPTSKKSVSRLMKWFQKLSTSFQSLWKRIISMFRRNRKEVTDDRSHNGNTPYWPLLPVN